METRNVQLTGLKSFTITLPKNWINEHNIKKKQKIYMKILKNGCLLMHPKKIDNDMEKVALIELNKTQSPEYLFRSMLGAYVSGSNKITIFSKEKFKPKFKEKIRNFVERLDGLTIEEENINSVYIKDEDFFTVKNYIKIYKSIAYNTLKMIEKLKDLFIQRDWLKVNDIIEYDNEINQNFWKIYHLSHLSLSLPMFVSQSLPKISNLYLLSLSFERIGDQIVNLGKIIKNADFEQLSDENFENIKQLLTECLSILTKSIDIVQHEDKDAANTLISTATIYQNKCEANFSKILDNKNLVIPLFKTINGFKNIGREFQNISELVFNYSLA